MQKILFFKTVLVFFIILINQPSTFNSFAQAPESFNYQAVVRDASGAALPNQFVKFRIGILEGGISGTEVFMETHALTTNAFGQASFNIGSGTIFIGSFNAINWGSSAHYLKIGVDPTGGNSFTIQMTTQLLSVPYALHARSVGGGDKGILVKANFGDGPELSPGAGTRMHLYPKKAAFRAGTVTGAHWDHENIGSYSSAIGHNVQADGPYSTAIGLSSHAKGFKSVAIGGSTYSSGEASVALGSGTRADGQFSTAMGAVTKALGDHSTAIGNSTEAIGNYSTAMGSGTEASGDYSTAMGYKSVASRNYSTAIGWSTKAHATCATTMGYDTQVNSYCGVALGRFNVGGGTLGDWVASDPLFEIGIGSSSTVRKNALTVLKNGKIGIGTTSPICNLHVKQSTNDSKTAGIRLERSDNTTHWNISTNGGSYNDLVFWYNSSTSIRGWIQSSNGAFTNTSDARLKQDINPIKNGLEKVMQLNPVTFRYKSNPSAELKSYGLIAQEVEEVFPEFVSENEGIKGLDYKNFAVVAIKAIQEQQEIIEKLNSDNDALKAEVEYVKSANKQMNSRLEKLEALFNASDLN